MIYLRQSRVERRRVLRGLGGIAVALPFLDAMLPAAATAQSKAALMPPRRLGFVYCPNGYIKKGWTPEQTGAGYTLTPALRSLAPVRDKVTVISGLACDPSKTRAGFHDRAICSFMTGVEMSKTEVRVGTSVDQIAAPVLGKNTPFTSLELGVQEVGPFGGPSFRTATQRLPIETNPRFVFERLFGDADRLDPAVMAELRARQRSMLDLTLASADDLRRDLGAGDRRKMEEYLDSVRDIERRLELTESIASKDIRLERPAGRPESYEEFVKVMFDLQVVALQTDMTRVWTFMMGQEASNMTFPMIDWPDSFHLTSHHSGDPAKIAAMGRINEYMVGLFTYMVGKMDAVKEGDRTLLDNTMLLFASSLGDSDRHMQVDLPVLLAGGASMGMGKGQHVQLEGEVPISNLYLTMLDKVGVPVDKLGDSTGELRGVTVI